MTDSTEMKWKKALMSILDQLEKSDYETLLEFLNKLTRRVKEETSRNKMPEKIIQIYGLEGSISAINEALDQIPRKDRPVQEPLRPFVDWLKTQEEKENKGKKRKLDEVGEEERSAAGPSIRCQTAERISISELKSRDQLLGTKAFHGKVIQKTKPRSYQNQDGKKNDLFCLGVADETGCMEVKVYKKELHKFFKEGHSYSFKNVIKDQNVVKVTKLSKVSEIRCVQVSEELEMETRKLITPESPVHSIDEAKKCPIKMNVSVKGVVEEISPVEETKVSNQRKKIKRQSLTLTDQTGSIQVCVWEEKTKLSGKLNLGDTVLMTHMKINDYRGNKTLSSSEFTEIHKVAKRRS